MEDNIKTEIGKSLKRKSSGVKGFFRLVVDFLFYIALIVCFIILFIAFYAGIAFIQEKLFVKETYITYMIKSPYSYLIFLIMMLVCGKISFLLSRGKKIEKSILPVKYLLVVVIALIYIVITSVVVVTKEGIYDYSFYNLKGEVYKFSDVEVVNTGFKEKGRNKGEFFYDVQLSSGKTFKLAFPSLTQPGKQYTNDTWQEYVDIDEIIMQEGAKKISSENGSQHVMMDKIYIDKLLKVVRNK